MSKKSTKALASATLMSLVLTTALSAGPVKAASQVQPTRVSGGDRYATAAKVATTNWTTSDSVVLVSGEGYADAVSASALAKKLNAPILLTTGNTLNSDAQSALNTLKPKNVYVIGGTASISQSIRDGLKANYTLTELGGQNRYETNIAVAKELVTLGVSPSNVMVVGGQGFADALSVAPVAAAKGQILLLANNDQASSQGAIDFVKDNKSTATIVGTSNVISDAIKNAFGSTATRVNGGSSRFDTNLAVLKAFSSDLKADKLYIANASAADPDNLYADALVASAVAGKYTAPLVLVDKDGTDATNNAVAYIKSENAKEIDVIGGTSVVPDSIISEITGTPVGPVDPEVSSVSDVDLNQVKVVFNQEVDSDTAEEVSNYKIDNVQLNNKGTKDGGGTADANSAKATLQDDNKTVLITLAKSKKQGDNLDLTVKKGILSSDKSTTIPECTQKVSFNDTTAPTISSVQARGNNKLTVEFSEPVNFSSTSVSQIASKFKINGKNITSFGLDTSISKIDDYVTGINAGEVWANKIEFYFTSSLPTGNNTLEVSDGDQASNGVTGKLSDVAGFPFKDSTQNFNVDTLTTAPQITSITAEDSGKIYINFDRPMDAKTATDVSNYGINGDNNNLPANSVELKKDDTQVKISNVTLKTGSNTVYIDNNVKDAYGNYIPDDTRKDVTLTQDTVKPAVSSVATLDDKTIRVKYNKDINIQSGKNTSNYKIKDNSGTDISSQIGNSDGTITVPGGSSSDTSASVFDIHMANKLSDSKYSITIKNIRDIASTPNTMPDYTTTFDGYGDVAPTVTGAYKAAAGEDPQRKVVVYFNKEMDSSSIDDVSNYKFKDNSSDADFIALPSGTTISAGSNNKSATIKFPSSYTTNLSDPASNENKIKELAVVGVKDVNGNALSVSYQSGTLAVNTNLPTIDSKSVSFDYDGNDLTVKFKYIGTNVDGSTYTDTIDKLDYTDFRVNGVEPSTGSLSGDNVVLRFTKNDPIVAATDTGYGYAGRDTTKINAVKYAGLGAKITTVSTNTIDVAGQSIASMTVAGGTAVVAYDYNAAPKTIAKDWRTGVVGDTNDNLTGVGTAGDGFIDVTFDTPIDPQSGISKDGFTFTSNVDGQPLKAKAVYVSGNTIRFTFDTSADNVSKDMYQKYFKTGSVFTVNAKDTVTVRTIQDQDDNYATYKPSSDDINIRTINFDGVGTN
ncbi:cell wall-binding repeat-containing protein [Clostridium ljungdahlii]|uniref:cell wall-binding repeat-containing protein n=1 Tax=Clostridium ljungdahlii TaxID=1538 RepID=UPI0038650A4C